MSGWEIDWKDARAYPDPEIATLSQWPWEFLRRNPEYIRLWNDLIFPFWDGHSIDESAAMEPARASAESGADHILVERSTDGGYKINSPSVLFRERFGVMPFPPPPGFATPGILFDHQFVGTRARPALARLPEGAPYKFSAPLAPGEMVVWFDLSWPLAPQLERAKRVLEGRASYLSSLGELEVATRRNHVRHYRDYLRLLDAEAAGATSREMADAIFSSTENLDPDYKGNEKVRNGLEAAHKLRDGGYRLIVL